VRNYPDYYRSETYDLVRRYSNNLLEIIEEGVKSGEIRRDLPPKFMRQVILGSIEHVCLTGIIFQRGITPDELTEDLCRFIFQGIRSTGGSAPRTTGETFCESGSTPCERSIVC